MTKGIIRPQPGDALLVVDVQNDFLPGGRLPIPSGHEVIPALNQVIQIFEAESLPIFATRDWHPVRHSSFYEQGGPWPAHCIANTLGASFAKELRLPQSTRVISKASHPEKEAYSGFEGTNLHQQLQGLKVSQLFVGGLATDYCVLNTVKDALHHRYRVYLLQDAIKAVNLSPHDGQRALDEMRTHGAIPVTTEMMSLGEGQIRAA